MLEITLKVELDKHDTSKLPPFQWVTLALLKAITHPGA